MKYSFLSLTSPVPEGFSFDPAPTLSSLRKGVFCLYTDDPAVVDRLILPWVNKICGMVVVGGRPWQWGSLGAFCYCWSVPRESVPFLSGLVQPYLEMIEKMREYDDRDRSHQWEAQRAAQDRVFLSRVQVEFRDAMLTADKNLRDAHSYLNQIIESLPDAMLVIDRDKKITAWNRAMETMTGVPKEDMLGKGDHAYAVPFYGEDRPLLVDLLYAPDDNLKHTYDVIKQEGRVLVGEVFAPHVFNGKGAYLMGSASLLYDAEGTIIGAIESLRDITERRQTMRELEKAKKVAEDAHQAQSRFLSNVSHEIRTPLNGIIGFAELIINTQSIENAQAMAQTVLHESDILLSLVNELLDQARIEAGRMEIECVCTDLHALIETVVKTVEVQAKKKGLEIILQTSRDVPRYLYADHLRVCQVLLNLMNNAVKMTEQGTVMLRTGIEPAEGDKRRVLFEVIDTGPGIPEDKKDLIFKRFAQVDSAASRKYGGTGLGLSVSRGLVELMGGTIGFRSRAGEGSTFWFVLPLVACDKNEAEKDGAIAEHEQKFVCEHCAILLVDDYVPNQEVARAHLASVGYEVEVAVDGLTALQRCAEKEYKLILMDVQMPGMDGLEATRRLRQQNEWAAHVVILGLTANADEKSRRDCLAAGMDGVITKPIRREAFLAEISRRLSVTRKEAVCMTAERGSLLPGQPMDYGETLREFGGDKKLLDEVVENFITCARSQVVAMEQAISTGDAGALSREAHKIKGAAANIAARPLAEATRAIEEKARAGDLSGMSGLFAVFKKEMDALEQFVRNGYT